VLQLRVHRCYEEIRVEVEGTGFLYNQVRNMVGTLIEVGRGHWEPDYVREILESCDRTKAGPTAPARGLCLQWVRYDMTRTYDPDPWELARAAKSARQLNPEGKPGAGAPSDNESGEPAPLPASPELEAIDQSSDDTDLPE
jgi:hypothetical protein